MSPHHSDHKPPALPVDKVLFGSVFQHIKLGSDKRMHTKHFTVSCTVKGLPPPRPYVITVIWLGLGPNSSYPWFLRLQVVYVLVLGELLRRILGSIVQSHLNSVQWTPFLSKFSKCHRPNAFQTHSVCESKAMPSLTSCPALRAFLVLTKTAGHTCPASLDYFADDYLMPEFFCSPHPEPIQEDLANLSEDFYLTYL